MVQNKQPLYVITDKVNSGALNELLNNTFGIDEQSIQYVKRGINSRKNRCTYAVMKAADLVGFITAWKTIFHPYTTYFAMVVHPRFRNGQVERLLLQQIEGNNHVTFPLQTSCWETNVSFKDFYERTGFKELRRTFITSLNVQNSIRLLVNTPSKLLKVQTFSELHELEEQREIIYFIMRTYEETHKSNPLGVYDENIWEQIIFGDDTILKGSFIVRDMNGLVGFALLHYSDMENKLEFGWRGTRDLTDLSYIHFLTSLQIKFALKSRYEVIEGEIDTTDIYSLEMLKYFPFSPAPAWITYQMKEGERCNDQSSLI
ncbi:N-acetyltransferase [Evansella halocellulosilytica]|uniref:GNAT family N-acetyltransferase n=1 Tax=Evansella halocellulosilytica TaxID=2011013 RepID=UPI001C5428ED|nr:GNAT family N-acetyltransferase [Evansella halocellulosilytica]